MNALNIEYPIMKFFKYTLLFLLVTLILNTISWYFIGKQKVLETSLSFFHQDEKHHPIDTLFIYSGYLSPSDSIPYGDISGFNESTRNDYLENLKVSSKANKIQYVNSTGEIFSNLSDGNINFLVNIEYKYPFYAEIYVGEISSDWYVGEYEQEYLWFFGWWQLKESEIGWPAV